MSTLSHYAPRGTCISCEATGVLLLAENCEACLPDVVTSWAEHVSAPNSVRTIKRHGLTLAMHAALFARQRGLCAICEDPERSRKTTAHGSGLVVDHDHKSGVVRGLLCRQCNVALGCLRDEDGWLARAKGYLKRVTPVNIRRERRRLAKVEERIERIEWEEGTAPPFLHEHRMRRRLSLIEDLSETA